MARPRKVIGISTGKISKKDRMNRELQESKLKVGRDQLETGAPKWLNDEAAYEYNRVVREAAKVDLLDNLDLSILAIYADNYSRYIVASKSLNEKGLTTEGKVGEIPSAYCRIANDSATQIMKCSTKLGLATTDRLKLIVPTKEEQTVNKYLKYL